VDTPYSYSMSRILISGAGVAGPTLAFWLSRAGHCITVVERAPDLRMGGQAVDLRGAGRIVVERMGLMPAVSAVTLRQEGMSCVDARNRVRAEMPVHAFGGEGMVSEIEVLRGDLSQVLSEATRDSVNYLFDDSLSDLRQDADGVDVTFAHADAGRFDLVVGADGVSSITRTLAFGPGGLQPLGCVMAWFSAPDPGDLDGWYRMFNAPGGRVASIRPGRVRGEAKASLGLRVPRGAELPSRRGEQRSLLAERFAGLGWKVPQLLAAMQTASDFSFTEVAQVHLPSWSRGRVVLLGDAAASPSPLTGLGTSVALVQAYVLAGELAAAGGDHRRAFDRYEEVCRPYVATAQDLPPGGAAGYAPMSALMIRAQALSMRLMTRWPVRGLLERQFAKAGNVELPGYAMAPA
jgi:2-polyprenyl-6-methoxyphenol hydroxylase-like FAD-dependent oxidoreductase